MVLPTMDWVLLYQLTISTVPIDMLPQLTPVFKVTLGLIKLTTEVVRTML